MINLKAYAITTKSSPRARSEHTGIRFCCGDEARARSEAEQAFREYAPRSVVTNVQPVAWVFGEAV